MRVAVKVDGCDKYADIARPEHDNPTYNLRDMFVACMGWAYEQGEYYPCAEYIKKLEQGIKELTFKGRQYKKYEPSNGWGTIGDALESLASWWNCIQEEAEEIPIECLYMRW